MQIIEKKIEWLDARKFSPYNLQIIIACGFEPFVINGHIELQKSIRLCQYICGVNISVFMQIPSLCEKVFELQNVTHWMPCPDYPKVYEL